MSDAEELAWSREVLGEVGPHVRKMVPRVLAQMEIELGQAGLGDQVVGDLSETEREEITQLCTAIRELAGDGRRVAVAAFASNPSAVLRAYFGYADLGEDDHLRWAFRQELQLPLTAATGSVVPSPRSASEDAGVTGVAGGTAGDSCDSGPVAAPALRPRPKSDSS